MLGKKSIRLLKKFSKTEIDDLSDFISSPYFNKENKLIEFWSILKEYYPEFDKINYEMIFSKLYPNIKFTESRIRNLFSDLNLILDKFLSIRILQNNHIQSDLFLLESLLKYREYDIFNKKYSTAIELINENSVKDEFYYNNLLNLLNYKFTYLNATDSDFKETENNISEINTTAIKHFLTTYLKNCQRILNKQRTFFNYSYTPEFFEFVKKIIEGNFTSFKNESYLLMYYYCVQLYMNYDEESYLNLKKTIFKNLNKFNRGDVTDTLVGLINYCRSRALAGENEYYFKTLDIYKMMSESEIWNEENLLRPTVYRGAASVAGVCKNFKWGEEFLNKFKNLQPLSQRESNFNLCMGRLKFDEGKFNEAIEFLSKVEYLDSSYKYETDTLLMRTFYELNEIESLLSKIDSFKHWINNNETIISKRYREIFKKMVNCFYKLTRLKLNPDGFKLGQLKKIVEADKSLVNRSWILEKIKNIESVLLKKTTLIQ